MCFTENEMYLGMEFLYKIHVNTTDCKYKANKLGDVISRDLVVCNQETHLKLRVVGVLLGTRKKGNMAID